MKVLSRFRHILAPCAALFVALTAMISANVPIAGALIAGAITWGAAAFALAPGKPSEGPTSPKDPPANGASRLPVLTGDDASTESGGTNSPQTPVKGRRR